MAGHEQRIPRARRRALRTLQGLGEEIRLARLGHGLSQADAAQAAALARASWGRMERSEAEGLRVVDLASASAVVGLDLHVRLYPGGGPLRDEPHVRLLARLGSVLPSGVGWATEVPLPNPGDRRAWDALIRVAGVRIGVEAETRARDSQELQRRIAAKVRDGGVEHVILLLANTRHNRLFIRSLGDGFQAAFPIDGRDALMKLRAGQDPGGSAIVLL